MSEGGAAGAETKTCPDCAESIQSAAKVCRYCGYRFDTGTSATQSAEAASSSKSPPGAAVLSLVVPGLGHFYLGERWRGAVFLVSFLVVTLGALLTDTIGPGWLIGIVAAVDAYRGAKLLEPSGHRREVGSAVWTMLVVALALTTAAVIIDDARDRDAAEREAEKLQRQQLEFDRQQREADRQLQQDLDREQRHAEEEQAYEDCLLERELNPESFNTCSAP